MERKPMIDLQDLLDGDYEPNLEFLGDGVDYWDYALTLTHSGDAFHESSCNVTRMQLEQLHLNAKRICKLLESA